VSMPSQAVIVAPAGTPSAVVDKIESAMEKATKDADFSDLVTNKLKFPVKFVGAKALAADIVTTAEGLKEVIEKTK
ncbi:MAG: tripartite tricarboxylate transporter substrate-binding protein, partial [Pseudomonadota bacterium]|nr:tripartite tricarboxylate transporter substrate-binding protein [Pseudomonadota bacterium]